MLGLGGESVNDAYYPFRRCNMLEAAFSTAQTLWMVSPPDQELPYDMCTINPARLLRIPEHRIAPGNAADCVILQERNVREAFTIHAEPRFVIRSGKLVCETTPSRREFPEGETPSDPVRSRAYRYRPAPARQRTRRRNQSSVRSRSPPA